MSSGNMLHRLGGGEWEVGMVYYIGRHGKEVYTGVEGTIITGGHVLSWSDGSSDWDLRDATSASSSESFRSCAVKNCWWAAVSVAARSASWDTWFSGF